MHQKKNGVMTTEGKAGDKWRGKMPKPWIWESSTLQDGVDRAPNMEERAAGKSERWRNTRRAGECKTW